MLSAYKILVRQTGQRDKLFRLTVVWQKNQQWHSPMLSFGMETKHTVLRITETLTTLIILLQTKYWNQNFLLFPFLQLWALKLWCFVVYSNGHNFRSQCGEYHFNCIRKLLLVSFPGFRSGYFRFLLGVLVFVLWKTPGKKIVSWSQFYRDANFWKSKLLWHPGIELPHPIPPRKKTRALLPIKSTSMPPNRLRVSNVHLYLTVKISEVFRGIPKLTQSWTVFRRFFDVGPEN